MYIYTAYHCKCIDPWLTRNRRFCPICKRRVYGNNEDLHAVEYSSDTDSDEPNDRTPLVQSRINNSNSLGVSTFRSFRVSQIIIFKYVGNFFYVFFYRDVFLLVEDLLILFLYILQFYHQSMLLIQTMILHHHKQIHRSHQTINIFLVLQFINHLQVN